MKRILFSIFFAFSIISLHATHECLQVEVLDVNPNEISVIAYFNEAIITTYFDKMTYGNVLHINPIRQEFKDLTRNRIYHEQMVEDIFYEQDHIRYWFPYYDGPRDYLIYVSIWFSPTNNSFHADYDMEQILPSYD